MGACLGAFIGDHLGSAFEFETKVPDDLIEMAMKMPGGMGPWRLAPGQVTDDSELAMCQLWGLSNMEAGKFDPLLIADRYLMWYQ